MKYLKAAVTAISYIYTAIKLVILCIRIRKISLINDKIQADKDIADAIKRNDTHKIAQLINYYRDG